MFDATIYKGLVEGPLGFPMVEAAARALDEAVKAAPAGTEYVKKSVGLVSESEFVEGERADVSIVTSEAVDRDKEVVLASGLDLTQFRANPVVTANHNYQAFPVGKAQWIKRCGTLHKAKTIYADKPKDWKDSWVPDAVWGMVKSGVLRGKSIGFFPIRSHEPTAAELASNPAWKGAKRIYDESLMFEYAVVGIPANHQSIVEMVAKGTVTQDVLDALGLNVDVPVISKAMNDVEIPGSMEWTKCQLHEELDDYLEEYGIEIKQFSEPMIEATLSDSIIVRVPGETYNDVRRYKIAWGMSDGRPVLVGEPKAVEITGVIVEKSLEEIAAIHKWLAKQRSKPTTPKIQIPTLPTSCTSLKEFERGVVQSLTQSFASVNLEQLVSDRFNLARGRV